MCCEHDECPLLAQSRHGLVHCTCLLLTQSGHCRLLKQNSDFCIRPPLRPTVAAHPIDNDIKVLGNANSRRYLKSRSGLRNIPDSAFELRRFFADNDERAFEHSPARGDPLIVHRTSPAPSTALFGSRPFQLTAYNDRRIAETVRGKLRTGASQDIMYSYPSRGTAVIVSARRAREKDHRIDLGGGRRESNART
jgi:hypothetical protein